MNTDTTLIFSLDADALASKLSHTLSIEQGAIERRSFPDGEHYLRLLTDCSQRHVILCAHLDHPNAKLLELIFLAQAARDQGALKVGLVVPYLPYMRQDKAFQAGEVVTSRFFAQLLSSHFDWLVTVDPHLHRYKSLDEIYTLQSTVVEAAPVIANWIIDNVTKPLLIGPDSESEQWVAHVASLAGAPYQILNKTRYGDYEVAVSPIDFSGFKQHTPVLVDDIISSGKTLQMTLAQLQQTALPKAICIAVHGLFAGDAYHLLQQQAEVLTCDSVPHPSNRITLAPALAEAVRAML